MSNRPPLCIPHTLRVEWGEELYASITAQIVATAEDETGKPHKFYPMLNRDAYELAPTEPEA